jgi:isopentenyl-diphosphate delta-isomerase
MEHVILVNEKDEVLGTMEKMDAHHKGVLHRAISVFIYNSRGQMLIHQRALNKYHSGGLWTNTCCSHPRPNESVLDAANRRLQEEMGMTCSLATSHSFIYKAALDQDLWEHELDHVLVGITDAEPLPNPEEVMNYRWIDLPVLHKELQDNPVSYTEWFKIICAQGIPGIE